jgi:signal transduction histidine kinase
MSLRTRLTLVYGTLFLTMGVILETITYLLAVQAVRGQFKVTVTGSAATHNGGTVRGENDILEQVARQQEAVQHQLVQSAVLTLLAVTALSVVLGYVVSGRMVRPLRQMTATARRLSESTLHERIGLDGPRDEIKELADTFDNMLDRLHRSFESQRQFVANASHELRTPLAINRTLIDVAVAKPGAPEAVRTLGTKLLGAIVRQERLIEGLLLLARSQHERQERVPGDLATLTANALEQFAGAAEQAGVTVTWHLGAARTVGDPVLLERCAGNLIENAIKYNSVERRVWVRTGETGTRAWLQVENTGPPVRQEQIDGIFQPFRRLQADRVHSAKGSGLGLSIVRSVMEFQHGTVEAIPRPGGGLIVTLLMPLTAPSHRFEPYREPLEKAEVDALQPGRFGVHQAQAPDA